MDKEQFLELVEEQLSLFFLDSKSGKKTDADKYRAEGFMRAGRLMGLVTKEELDQAMDKAHFGVYSMSISEHEKQRRDVRLGSAKERDYQDFLTPSYKRGEKYRAQEIKESTDKG